jgi:hypothetical protein
VPHIFIYPTLSDNFFSEILEIYRDDFPSTNFVIKEILAAVSQKILLAH